MTPKTIPMRTRENKFQSSKELCNHKQNFTISFISPTYSFVSYENQNLFSTFGVVNIFSSEKILKNGSRTEIYNTTEVNNFGKRVVARLLLGLQVDYFV